MQLYAAVDLHGDNGFYAVVDENNRRVFKKRLPNEIGEVLAALEPFREDLASIAVESTCNWYWLLDGLADDGYGDRLHLANPNAMQQYKGLKETDDETDAFFIANLSRLGCLPTGYIYPREDRGLRDLVRRRTFLVHSRTQYVLSFKSLVSRELGQRMSANDVHKLYPKQVEDLFEDQNVVHMGKIGISVIRFLAERIREVDKLIRDQAKLRPEYEKLQSAPGIGFVLAVTIMLETGDIRRFPKVGNYTSYCRCVRATRDSNGKKKADNNRKNGNAYLSWAYVEAANMMRRYCEEARNWYDRKNKRSKRVVATKALSSKITKACYFIMRDQLEFDVKMMFG